MQKIFSENEISEIAEMVVAHIYKNINKKGATVVALSGDLGAGKTTLVQAIGKQFGVKQKMVSPTFILLKSYKIKHEHFKQVHHIDAYRLENPEHVSRLNWEKLLEKPGNIIFLEWPEQIQGLVPKGAIRIKLEHAKGDKRKISLK